MHDLVHQVVELYPILALGHNLELHVFSYNHSG